MENLIRLSHYILDGSTIVHVFRTSGKFHSNLEEDLDNVVKGILPQIDVEVKDNLRKSFYNDAYGEADKRVKDLALS